MKENTKRTLESLVESHLISVISNAISIARHSKRSRRTILASDVLTALRLEGTPLDLPTNAGYSDNTTIDLNAFLNGEINVNTQRKQGHQQHQQQLDPPSEMGMVMHWLAVEGRQPATPLNPIELKQHLQSHSSTKTYLHGNADTSNDYEDNEEGFNNEDIDEEQVVIRNLLPRLLSQELQLYFTRITLALQKGDRQEQDAALLRLRYDSGIQELVPFFLNFLTPTGNSQMANVQRSRLRIRCLYNLALNKHLHLELYLEKVVPLILNSIVPKTLSLNPYDHYKLRDEASRTLCAVWTIFGEKYPNFQSSVIRVLCQALSHSVESRYGALIALGDLGPKVVDAVLLPFVAQFWTECEMKLRTCQDDGDRFGLYRLQDAILYTMSVFLSSGVRKRFETLDSEKTSDVFGDQLVPFLGKVTDCEYFTSFI